MTLARKLLAAACAGAAALTAAPASAQPLTALTNNNGLVSFDSVTPNTLGPQLAITGLAMNDAIIAIDRDPSSGLLYGLGKQSRMYRIDEASGAAIQEGSVFNAPLTSQNVVADMDFDPRFNGVARIITDTDQNLTWIAGSGQAFADTTIAWAAPHPADNPNAIALAFSNNFPQGQSPTAFVYDVGDDQFAMLGGPGASPSPAAGKLTPIGAAGAISAVTTVGGLDSAPDGTMFALLRSDPNGAGGPDPLATRLFTFDTTTGQPTPVGGSFSAALIGNGANTMIDVATAPVTNNVSFSAAGYAAGESSRTVTVTVTRSQSLGAAFVTFATSDATALAGRDYKAEGGTLSFLNGQTSKTVDVKIRSDVVDEAAETFNLTLSNPVGGRAAIAGPASVAIAIEDDDSGPPASSTLTALTTTNGLVTFDSANPTVVSAALAVTGLAAGDELVAIDRRPATGQLYAMGKESRLYTIDESTGAATQVGSGQFAPSLAGSSWGFDFDPVADRIRTSPNLSGQNLRIDPTSGEAIAESPYVYDAADPHAGAAPNLVALAYANNVPGASETTLFGYDYQQDTLLRIGSPGGAPAPASSGATFTIGASGLSAGTSINVGMDVGPDGTGWALMRDFSDTTRLNTVNFESGVLNLVGDVGNGDPIYRDVTAPAVTNVMRLGADSLSATESGPATVTVTRSQALGAASVDYTTSDGSATAGSDYTATAGTLTFAAGEASKDIAVPVASDNSTEGGPETFTVALANARGGVASLGAPAAATVTIADTSTARADTGKSRVTTCHRARQKLVKQKAVLVCVRSNEAGRASATGKLRIRGVKKAVTLKRVAGAVKRGTKRTLRLKLPSKVRALLTSHGHRATVKLGIRVRDAAGNERRLTRTVKASR
jgi:hypothetical protein